jgi:GT2 family glycosyltransferase
MKITVILCTYNRCHSLRRTLEGIALSILPDSVVWEVLVVDNNSSDQTREVVEDFSRRQPGRFRYLFEPEPGKSHALNSGIREALGEILAFTDDDVLVEPAWLRDLTAALDGDEWAGAAGRTLLQEGFSPPRWLSLKGQYVLAPFAMFDLGSVPGELHEAPFGNNMAFRKSIFQKYGGFRTDLGPRPGNMIRGEDTEFGCRLLAAGEPLRYESSAVVYHQVNEDRIRKEYFLAWGFDHARASIRIFGVQRGTKHYVAGVPLYLFRRLVVWTLRWVIAVDPGHRFHCKLKVWARVGEIVECYQQSRAAIGQSGPLAGRRTSDPRCEGANNVVVKNSHESFAADNGVRRD